MKHLKRTTIQAGVTTVALAAAVTGTALAQSTSAPAGTTATDTAEVEEQEPELNGSITAPDDETLSEEDEAAQLAELDGLISEQDAIDAATADGGTADAATLENENGSVVYEVEVTNADGTVDEATVDAGTGDVLGREADDDESADDSDDADDSVDDADEA